MIARAHGASRRSSAAEKWAREYLEADRRNRLRDFLLGSDAPEVQADAAPIGELIREWLAGDAHPDSPGGLAPSTWDSYRGIASRHIIGNPVLREMKKTGEVVEVQPGIKPLGRGGYAIGHLPARDFGNADAPKRWVQAMRAAGVTSSTEERAWKVLSSALSWAVEDDTWPVSANGCLMLQRRRGMRRASRRAGSGKARRVTSGKRRNDLTSWALSPLAVERDPTGDARASAPAFAPSLHCGTRLRFRSSTGSRCATRRFGRLPLAMLENGAQPCARCSVTGSWTPARRQERRDGRGDLPSTCSLQKILRRGEPRLSLTAIRLTLTTSSFVVISAVMALQMVI